MKALLLFALALTLVAPPALAALQDHIPGLRDQESGGVVLLARCEDPLQPICRVACDVQHLMPDWYNKIVECLP